MIPTRHGHLIKAHRTPRPASRRPDADERPGVASIGDQRLPDRIIRSGTESEGEPETPLGMTMPRHPSFKDELPVLAIGAPRRGEFVDLAVLGSEALLEAGHCPRRAGCGQFVQLGVVGGEVSKKRVPGVGDTKPASGHIPMVWHRSDHCAGPA